MSRVGAPPRAAAAIRNRAALQAGRRPGRSAPPRAAVAIRIGIGTRARGEGNRRGRGAVHDTKPGDRRGRQGSRPLCPYPQVAVFDGSGDVFDAANFSCANPD